MYRPSAFAVDDTAVLHDVMRRRVFVTIAAIRDGAVQFAYAPVAVDADNGPRGGVRFHLAMRNPLAGLEDGTRVWLSVMADDAYVSPDWYRTIVTVPTWNYIAVEGEGVVRRHSREELRKLVLDLSAMEEEKLLPKKPWTIDKVPQTRTEALLNGIVGFSLSFERLEGKFKLSQDKNPEDVAGVIAGLEARGDAASVAVVTAMRGLENDALQIPIVIPDGARAPVRDPLRRVTVGPGTHSADALFGRDNNFCHFGVRCVCERLSPAAGQRMDDAHAGTGRI